MNLDGYNGKSIQTEEDAISFVSWGNREKVISEFIR